MKKILIPVLFILTVSAFSQNINLTLGSSGTFTLKDASTNFVTLSNTDSLLSMSYGIKLPNTTSLKTGVIYKDALPFIHNFAPSNSYGHNTFVGELSGNFTMTAPSSFNSSYNTAFGYGTLSSNTTGYSNTAIGFLSMNNNTEGYDNTAVGLQTLFFNTTGNFNTAFGQTALFSNTSGFSNT